MKNLIPLAKYVLAQNKLEENLGLGHYAILKKIENYTEFITKPLELGMFVPCHLDGTIIEEITQFDPDITSQYYAAQIWQNSLFEEAKERVLFDGFYEFNPTQTNPDVKSVRNIENVNVFWYNSIECWYLSHGIFTIENLVKYNLELKPNVSSMFGF